MSALVAKLVSPVVWRIPGHGARMLFGFALAEHGSMLDLKLAARRTTCPERRSAYLRHMMDETRHAQMFALRSAELRRADGQDSLGFPVADTEQLFDKLGEVRFLAFVHLGEGRARRQFETYRDWFSARGDTKSRALFDAILKDETQHEAYTWELLKQLSGGEQHARRELRKAAAWEAWRTWRRMGRFLAEKVYFVMMVALYLLLAPFALLARALRPARSGWVIPANETSLEVAARPHAALALPSSTIRT